MKKYVIDTNALLSFVTDRNLSQQMKIAEIFRDAAKMNARIACPQNVLTEFVYVMDKVYGIQKGRIKRILHDFIAMPGVVIVHELDFQSVLSCWPELIPDFGDAVIASVCESNKPSIIVTFGHKFGRKLGSLGFELALAP